MQENLVQDSCIDIPSPKDYGYEQIVGGMGDLPKVRMDIGTVFNQNAPHNPNTFYACTDYANAHGVNILSFIEARSLRLADSVVKEIDPATRWPEFLAHGAGISSGYSLQGAVNLALKDGLISGFARCFTLESFLSALESYPIQTGSNSIDWNATAKNNFIVVRGKCYGHSFLAVSKDDEKRLIKIKNSDGPEWGDHGYFYVSYDDFSILFSGYALFGVQHKALMEKLNVEKNRDLAYQRGYWNGLNADKNGTRYEGFAMLSHLGKPIWNSERPNSPITKQEFAWMISSLTGNKFNFAGLPNETITR